jgi:uncharacterized membrane protein (Fun14 family)
MVFDSIAMVVGTLPIDGFDFRQLGIETGGGAVIGGVLGFIAKQIAKLIAVIIGLELALLKFLEARGVLEVNWAKLTDASANATEAASENAGQAATYVESVLETLPLAAGFTGGFAAAFKMS